MKYFRFFTIFDLFQLPAKFYFNGNSKMTSSIGIFFSFVIYSFLIYTFATSSLLSKKNPIVLCQSVQTRHAPKIHFNKNTSLNFGVYDIYGLRINDPSIFSVNFKYYHNATYEFKELRGCTPDDFPNEAIGTNISNFFCLKNKSLVIEGSYDDYSIQFIIISLYPCNNITSNGTCKSQEEIEKFFNSFPNNKFFGLRYRNSKIETDDYENPFKISDNVETQMIDAKLRKRINIYLKNAIVETDDGWLTPSKTKLEDIVFDSKDYDMQFRTDPAMPFFQYHIFATKENLECSRRYQKLPETLAALLGIHSFFAYAGIVFIKFFNYVSTLNLVLNKFYEFPDCGQKKKKQRKTNKKPEINKELSYKEKTNQKAFKVKKSNDDQDKEKIKLSEIPFQIQKQIELNSGEKIINTVELPIKLVSQIPLKIIKEDSFILENYSKEEPLKSKDNFDKNNENFIKKNEFTNKNSKASNVNLSQQNKMSSKLLNRDTQKTTQNIEYLKDKIKENEENKLNLSYLGYIKYLCFKTSRFLFRTKLPLHYELIQQAEKTFKKDLDLVNIIFKLHELEKLKILLLNEDQLVLFNYLSKPLIVTKNTNTDNLQNIRNSTKNVTRLINSFTNRQDLMEESYKRIKAENNKTINKKLIELLDIRIQKEELHKTLEQNK